MPGEVPVLHMYRGWKLTDFCNNTIYSSLHRYPIFLDLLWQALSGRTSGLARRRHIQKVKKLVMIDVLLQGQVVTLSCFTLLQHEEIPF